MTEMKNQSSHLQRFVSALLSGTVAIALNMVALKAADLVPLATAKGGLLRLLIRGLALPMLSVVDTNRWSWLATSPSRLFQDGFHVFVGLMMALFYAFVVERAISGEAVRKGAIYALVVWLLNALFVLPMTGEGIAGMAHLELAGIIWYAAAHFLFFLTLAVTYAHLMKPPVQPIFQ